MDTSVLMSLEEKIATWPNMADSDIVQQIVSAYGVDVQADRTPTVHQENDTTIVQRGTDIQFVRELAQRNGMEFYFETDTDSGDVVAYFRPPQLDGHAAARPRHPVRRREQPAQLLGAARRSTCRSTVKTQQMDVQAEQPNIGAGRRHAARQARATRTPTALIGEPLGSLVTPQDAQAQMLLLGPPTSDATELQTHRAGGARRGGLVHHGAGRDQQRRLPGGAAAASAGAGQGRRQALQRQVLRHPRRARV